MVSGRNLESFRIHSPNPVEHNHPLLIATMQGACQCQLIIDPDKKGGVFELVLYGQVEIGNRRGGLLRATRHEAGIPRHQLR